MMLAPAGRDLTAAEVHPLLDPVAYLGVHGRAVWTRENLAVGCLHHLPVDSKNTTWPRQALGGRFLLVADCRLDARNELIKSLSLSQDPAIPGGDEDLLLAAYLRWGKDCARHLLGEFAFVVFDRLTQEIYGCADAVGTRRLFYGQSASGCFLIASEEACLLAVPELAVGWSELGLACWLSAAPLRELSLFKEIRVLACGRQLERTPAACRTTRWWRYESIPVIRHHRLADYADHYRALLQRAVADRMADQSGPVICELSGGMDSSSIAVSGVAAAGGDGARIISLSSLFPDFPQCNEAALIAQIRQRLGIDESIELDGFSIVMETASDHSPLRAESPIALNSPGLRQVFREAVGRGCQVILTGYGGDEFTQGNPAYATMARLRRGDLSVAGDLRDAARARGASLSHTIMSRLARPMLRAITPRTVDHWLFGRRRVARDLPGWLRHDRHLVASVAEQMRRYSEFPGLNAYQQWLLSRLRRSGSWMVLDIYRLNAAAASVDVRSPFLDLRILEFALGTPPDLWCRRGLGKFLPRLAFSETLPYDVCWASEKVYLNEVFDAVWHIRQATIAAAVRQARSRIEPSSLLQQMLPAETELDRPTDNQAKLNYAFLLAAWINQRHPAS